MFESPASGASAIVQALFETQAIRVSPSDQPFWYTSGTLGPYYINTHFLYGSETEANQLLSLIEAAVAQPLDLPQTLASAILEHEQQQPVFKAVIDLLADEASQIDCDFISGGERRDFFFSIPVAARLGKPHIAILKDGRTIGCDGNFQHAKLLKTADLRGQVGLHLADLVTEASSYIRAWIPAIERLGANMRQTIVVVDRNQGGQAILATAGVELIALTQIAEPLFVTAVEKSLITTDQHVQIRSFMSDPHQYMTDFFNKHPGFLSQQLALGGKSAERASRCLSLGYDQV